MAMQDHVPDPRITFESLAPGEPQPLTALASCRPVLRTLMGAECGQAVDILSEWIWNPNQDDAEVHQLFVNAVQLVKNIKALC